MAEIYSSDKKAKKPPSENVLPKRDAQEAQVEVSKLIGRSRTTLGSFVAQPKSINFQGQHKKEKIILLVRKHWILNLPWMLSAGMLAIFPLALTQTNVLSLIPPEVFNAALLLWYLLIMAIIIEGFLTWLFNVGIITNERILDIDFSSLLLQRTSDTQINKIQDVTVEKGGFLRTILGYGSIYVQTAGEKQEIEFVDIPNPQVVATMLKKLRLALQDKNGQAK